MKLNERGSLNNLLLPLVIVIVLLLSALGFGGWAYMERQSYKDRSDDKVEAAVEIAKKKLSDEKDNEFLEKEKFPLDSYQGPAELGGLALKYPKTWSAYISTGDEPFFIFNPRFIPSGDTSKYALRINVVNSPYRDVVSSFEGQLEEGKLKSKAYSLPKLPKVIGLRFDGEIEEGKLGSVVVLPLRDKTITIANEVPDLKGDFDKIVLPSITFSP